MRKVNEPSLGCGDIIIPNLFYIGFLFNLFSVREVGRFPMLVTIR